LVEKSALLQGPIAALWQTVAMVARVLRVIKWLGTIPVVAVCSLCHRQFRVPLNSMKQVGDAQESLRVQFAEHKCTPGIVS
jgi:hypothetical protein